MELMRSITAAELKTVLDWAAAEGWNPGLDDADAFHAADPDGFFATFIDGAPVAAISVVSHSPGLAFLGLYLCRPDWRGRGIGLRLWTDALAHAGDRCVGLDGVPAQQSNYARSGFVATGGTRRFAGRIEGAEGAAVRPATAADSAALTAMEAAASGYGKPAFMAAWLGPASSRRSLVLARDGEIEGFATLRRCRDGHKIGPLVARGMEAAEVLLLATSAAAGDGTVILDVPDSQTDLTALCRRLGMTCSFETARMYRGPAPVPTEPLVAAVATLELG